MTLISSGLPKFKISPKLLAETHVRVSTELGLETSFDTITFSESREFGANSGGGKTIYLEYTTEYKGKRTTYTCHLDLNQKEEFARILWPQKVEPKAA